MTLFEAKTRGGKYSLRAYESFGGLTVESCTNGIVRGSMGPVTPGEARTWLDERMRDSAEIDGIRYSIILDHLPKPPETNI